MTAETIGLEQRVQAALSRFTSGHRAPPTAAEVIALVTADLAPRIEAATSTVRARSSRSPHPDKVTPGTTTRRTL